VVNKPQTRWNGTCAVPPQIARVWVGVLEHPEQGGGGVLAVRVRWAQHRDHGLGLGRERVEFESFGVEQVVEGCENETKGEERRRGGRGYVEAHSVMFLISRTGQR
jgi:hypothetical protein